MKLFGLDDEILLDEIPFSFDLNKKIFLTSLAYLEGVSMPRIFPKIYTSNTLKLQFLRWLEYKNMEFNETNFHIWKPYEPEKITLSNGTTFEVLPCCPQDNTTNMLLIFRKGSMVTHIYVGLCSDLRSVLLNSIVLSWLRRDGFKADMYKPLNNENSCVECGLRRAIAEIKSVVNKDMISKLVIELPLFGFESLITRVATEFEGLVALYGFIKKLFMMLPNAENNPFTDNLERARIFIIGIGSEECLKNLKLNSAAPVEKCLIKWSPLPSINDLSLFSEVFRPKNLYGTPVHIKDMVQISSFKCCTSMIGMQRQSIEKVHCCLESYQKLCLQVLDFVKNISDQARNQEHGGDSVQRENLNEAQTTSHQQNDQNTLIEKTKHAESTSSDSRTDKGNSTTVATVQTSRQTPRNDSCDPSTSSVETLQKTPTSANETAEKTLQNNLPEKDKRKQPATRSPMQSLVYRKGKKGIAFIDDDDDE